MRILILFHVEITIFNKYTKSCNIPLKTMNVDSDTANRVALANWFPYFDRTVFHYVSRSGGRKRKHASVTIFPNWRALYETELWRLLVILETT